MTDHVYRIVEVVGSSSTGVDDAIANAIARANRTVRNLDWFETVAVRGEIVDGRIAYTQVTLKLGFRLDPAD